MSLIKFTSEKLINKGKTGIFCTLDAFSIANSIEYYINNNDIAKLHGKNGRKFVIDNFNQEKIWNKLEKIYNN